MRSIKSSLTTSEFPDAQPGIRSVSPPRLHSRYNPQAEASRYADASVQIPFPDFIVVTEPGEGFLAEALKKKFPKAKICAVRYQNDFYRESDTLWDFCWRPESGIPLETFLFNAIPDESMPASVFIPWKAAETFWPEEAKAAWEAIGNFIRLQQSVMATRAAFGRRWLKNCIKNIAKAEFPARCPEITAPPLIVASGPQLEQFPASFFEEISSLFFLCALSSASSFLVARGVYPDAIISTDGGYWAGRLFAKDFLSVPVMFPPEACIPDSVLKKTPCVFLSYGSVLERELFSLCCIEPIPAERNGTVAGTAASFFLRHVKGSVYAAGLDLKSGKRFQHARPHPFSPEKSGTFLRLSPLESQAAKEAFSSSLPVYRSWFENMRKDSARRFFRIESCKSELPPLGKIRAVTLSEIKAALSLHAAEKPRGSKRQTEEFKPSSPLSRDERSRAVRNWLFSMADKVAMSKTLTEIESEVIKMHTYQGFLLFVKMGASGNVEKSAETLLSLRKSAQAFLIELAGKLN